MIVFAYNHKSPSPVKCGHTVYIYIYIYVHSLVKMELCEPLFPSYMLILMKEIHSVTVL